MPNTTDAEFKKTIQTVGRPGTTDLGYQDSLLKDPPNNVEDAPLETKDGYRHDLENKGYSQQSPKEKEEMAELEQRLSKNK